MDTRQYVIKITSGSKEHIAVKKVMENLFRVLNKELAGDMEFYIKPVKQIKFGKYLYGLESKGTLDNRSIKL